MPMTRYRSHLFLPATSGQFVEKAARRGADAIIVDLEDSISMARKDEARPLAAQAIGYLAAQGARVMLRVNSEPHLLQRDLESAPVDALTAIMLPKVDSPDDVANAVDLLQQLHAPEALARISLIATIESPRGVLNAFSIAQSSARISALAFGSEDYSSAMGLDPSPELLRWPAQQVVTAAHACALQCLGLAGSVADMSDLAAYEELARASRAIGFTGSVAIHPAQVGILNRCFQPSEEQRRWALRVVAAFDNAGDNGVVTLDGKMIDLPIVERARHYLEH